MTGTPKILKRPVQLPSPTPKATKPNPPKKSTTTKKATMNELRDAFLASYMELLNLDENTTFEDLPRAQKRECIAAWQEEKEEAGGALGRT